jgi:phage-related protein
MINTDLSNIKKWSEDWLITFNNPDKTDIMLFESRQGNLNFKFGQTDILSVDFHKQLGIVFSSDGKGQVPYLHHKTSMTKESDFKSSHNTMVYFN